MGIMSDDPLIDDSELDEFDWDQHVTSGGNTVKSYHRLMHTTCLCLSAVLFKCAASLLGRAAHHGAKMRAPERVRTFGARPPSRDPGFFYPDEPVEFEQPVFFRTIIKSPNVWIDAHPDDYFEE